MPLQIEIPHHVELRPIGETLKLPAIAIFPGDSDPHVLVRITVEGEPKTLAQRLASAYRCPPELKRIPRGKRAGIPMTPQAWRDFHAPPGSRFIVTVDVVFHESDPMGDPMPSAQRVRETCEITIAAGETVAPSLAATANNQAGVLVDPGWIAIDFGTSNSTATILNTRERVPADGFPPEQEARFRKSLQDWLREPSEKWAPELDRADWAHFIEELTKTLECDPKGAFAKHAGAEFHQAVRHLEFSLRACPSEVLRRAACRRLSSIYQDVFQTPPLRSWRLFPAVLDPQLKSEELLSELEVIGLDDPITGVKINMGRRVYQNRCKALADAKVDELSQLRTRFHFSPKRYLGRSQNVLVGTGDQQKSVGAERLIQACWIKIRELAESYKTSSGEFDEARLQTVILTYPTVAPPHVRRDIRKLAEEIGFSDVVIEYDEAIAAVIFYLYREFGGDMDLSLEAFKVRCRMVKEGQWTQNVLVFDVGGGTTDIALVELTMEDRTPADAVKAGAAGRYYVITPRLIGATGHQYLGGELITLQVFRLLKVVLADCLVTASARGLISQADLAHKFRGFPAGYLDDNKNSYKSGALVRDLLSRPAIKPSEAAREALEAAEKVLPTKWNVDPARLQLFTTLWEMADEAKIQLGGRPGESNGTGIYSISSDRIELILRQAGYADATFGDGSETASHAARMALSASIDEAQFDAVAEPVVQDAARLARSLLSEGLSGDGKGSQVDWLILSGKTCNMGLVRREIGREFRQHRQLTWIPGRTTFEPEYAKLATSVGACYATTLRRLAADPEGSIQTLKRGHNCLFFDIKNLFSSLPCDFLLWLGGENDAELFRRGERLRRIDDSDEGKALSNFAGSEQGWMHLLLSMFVYRRDSRDGGTPEPRWGSFDGKALQRRINQENDEWIKPMRCRFEVNQRLEIYILICRGLPHHRVEESSGSRVIAPDVLDNSGQDGLLRLAGDIGVIPVTGGVPREDEHTLLFSAETVLDKIFCIEKESLPGAISVAELPIQKNGTPYQIMLRKPGEKVWKSVATFAAIPIRSDYETYYRLSVDGKGVLRLHVGEVPYATAENERQMMDEEGTVFRAPLQPVEERPPTERDPFCGIH